MSWTGLLEDGSEVKGTLKIPEVSHEAIDGLSDYVVNLNFTLHKSLLTTPSNSSNSASSLLHQLAMTS